MGNKPEVTIYTLAYAGDIQRVLDMLNQDKSLITRTDNNERMLIHWAALGGHTVLIHHLLLLKSPVDPKDDMSMTPIMLAASAGRIDVVRLLIGSGANINSQNIKGHSSLQYAASKGWKDIVKLLLDEGAEVNICDDEGARPLHRASSIGHLPIVQLLLSCENIDINARDSEGNTPLHLSCEEDRREIAKLLVERGALLDMLNKKKKTPLDVASVALAKLLRSLV